MENPRVMHHTPDVRSTMAWLHTPYLNIEYVAARLYGHSSRMYTQRLRRKLNRIVPFDSWEMEQLAQIKQELLNHVLDCKPKELRP